MLYCQHTFQKNPSFYSSHVRMNVLEVGKKRFKSSLDQLMELTTTLPCDGQALRANVT